MKKKRYQILAILMTMVFIFAGCSAGSKDAGQNSTAASSALREEKAVADYDMAEVMPEEAGEGAAVADTAGQGSEQVADPNRKLVKRQYLSMETRNFAGLTDSVRDKVTAAGGYIENSSVSGTSIGIEGKRYASYTIRIPVTKVEGFLSSVKGEGNVTQYSENVEDVTLNYVDTESHIAALKTEQETLMSMLEQSGDLETLLAIQQRLTDIRYQLENYESQLRLYDNAIEYSTVSLEIMEVERETSADEGNFGSRLKERLSSNFYNLGKGLETAALWFLGALPVWVLLAVVAVAIIIVIKMVRRRRSNKGREQRQPGQEEEEKEEKKEEQQK